MEQNPKYENMLPIVENSLGRNAYIFVKTLPEIENCLKLLRKMPQLVLLGGLVKDNLLTKSELIRISEISGISELHGGLVAALNQNIVQNLSIIQSPLINLIFTFQAICKLKEESQ